MGPEFEFALRLPERGSRLLLRTLHEQVRAAILDGRLKPGARLPATRAFAADYGVSRNTAVALYDLLLSEGYLIAHGKAGTRVADVLAKAPLRERAASARAAQRLPEFWRHQTLPAAKLPRVRFDFASAFPSRRSFRSHCGNACQRVRCAHTRRRLSAMPMRRASSRCAMRSHGMCRSRVRLLAAQRM